MSAYDIVMLFHVASMILMLVDLVYVISQKPSQMQAYIITLLMCTILMYAGYYIELKAKNVDVALMGTIVSYLGKPFISLSAFMLICDYYKFKIPTAIYTVLVCLCAGISFSVYNTADTRLYYSDWSFDPTNKFAPLHLEIGPIYYVYLAQLIFFCVACIYVTVKGYNKSKKTKEDHRYAQYFALIPILAMASLLIYFTGISNQYDTSIFGVSAGIICLSILFFKYRLFDALNIAKDEALENSPTGLIVVNCDNNITYTNVFGKMMLDTCLSLEQLIEMESDEIHINFEQKVYEIKRKLIELKGNVACTSYEISDITNLVNIQQVLEDKVKERTERIESIQRRIVSSFASIVEARSLETGSHITRTSEYVRKTANALRRKGLYKDVLTDHYITLLSDAAPLHDIGKISVADAILLKPGKLSADEFEKMKVHAEVGARIIETTMRGVEEDEYVKLSVDVAKYHHERWDGTGYPYGLKADEIPLSARIMAIADCYDALINERCYKAAFSKEQAIEIIESESGSHFDPDIVKAFLSTVKKK